MLVLPRHWHVFAICCRGGDWRARVGANDSMLFNRGEFHDEFGPIFQASNLDCSLII
jgi:hypothetical protein